jgi:hypothetical protein
MNVIQKATDDIKYRIPIQILEKAFVTRLFGSWKPANRTSLDDMILNNVIRARVLVDCNLIGGMEAIVPLQNLPQEKPTEYMTVIHIPKTRTQGKSINSVLHVSFLSAGAAASWTGSNAVGSVGSYASSESTALMAATSGMLSAFDKIPVTSTSRAELIAENTILIRDSVSISGNSFLRCVLANDDNLSGIQVRSYSYFCNLVEYAVKSYIYNTLIISMDQGELQGGAQLGIFKEIIQGYADAEMNYRDYLKNVWEAVALMNDDAQYSRYIKLIIGGNR